MTFLELCKRLAQESALPGGASAIATTVSQSGEAKRIVDWAQTSWLAIQGAAKWSFLWERPALVMLAGTSTLAGTLEASRYDKESCYIDAAGQMGPFPGYLPWDLFRYQYPVVQPGPQFGIWTVAPDRSIRVDQQVLVDTSFFVERYKNPSELSGDGDTPEMPDDLHMLIVWNALVYHANYDEAGVQRLTAVEECNRLDSLLRERCLPEMRLGGPLGGE